MQDAGVRRQADLFPASTGRVTTDFVSGRQPKIDVSGLAISRYD